MSVPDFQSIMLPLLKATNNGKQWQLTAIREELARSFHLSPDERRELLPSGKTDLVGLILISSVVGGMFFMIFNQTNEFNVPIASPSMIAWGYWAATIVIGIRYLKSLNWFEKIVLVLGFLRILNIWNDDLGFLFSQIIAIISIMILTIIRVEK